MQDDFIEQNKLVRPRIIRESTNRPNIKYMVSLHTGPTKLVEVAANLVQTFWPQKQIGMQLMPRDYSPHGRRLVVAVVVVVKKVRALWNFNFDKLLYVSSRTIYYVKVPTYFAVSERNLVL